MIRFPYNKPLSIITDNGIINGIVIKANNNFITLKNVKFNEVELEGLYYIDRSKITGYSSKSEPKEENSVHIINFSEVVNAGK